MAKQPEQPAVTQIYPWCVFIIFLGIVGGGLVYAIIIQIEFNRVKNPSLLEANQLFTSMAKDLNPGLLLTNPASYQGRTLRSSHSATLPPPVTNHKEG